MIEEKTCVKCFFWLKNVSGLCDRNLKDGHVCCKLGGDFSVIHLNHVCKILTRQETEEWAWSLGFKIIFRPTI